MTLLSRHVGEAAEYNSVRVNTLRRSVDGSKLPGCQSNLVAVSVPRPRGETAIKKFSPALLAALAGMSAITHAHADPNSLTSEQIGQLYMNEMKINGTTLKCFQAGQEIIYEVGLQNAKEVEKRFKAVRLDGSEFEIMLSDNSGLACTIVRRKKIE